MKLPAIGVFLLSAASLMAQQGLPRNNPPPYTTPPTLPGEQNPSQPMPPDTTAPPLEAPPSAEIQTQIQNKLATEPLLTSTSVAASVDDKSVVLSGSVENEQQHDLARRIAESYAGNRRIVDKIQIQGRT